MCMPSCNGGRTPHRDGYADVVGPAMKCVVLIETQEYELLVPYLPTAVLGRGAAGAGVIVDARGYILTCYHVVKDSAGIKIEVEGEDKVLDARVIAKDEKHDLALLKVTFTKKHPTAMQDIIRLQPGDSVFAIGNPFNSGKTVSRGIISGIDTGPNAWPEIKTDTTINPGNSGGGLFDSNGYLVGICESILNPTGQRVNIGIAYCTPLADAEELLKQIQINERGIRFPHK
jgi:serine protease DegS